MRGRAIARSLSVKVKSVSCANVRKLSPEKSRSRSASSICSTKMSGMVRLVAVMTCAAIALVSCGRSSHEQALSLRGVESSLRVAGVRHIQVITPPRHTPAYGQHLVFPSNPPFGAQYLFIRIFRTPRAAKDSPVIAQGRKYFPRENAHNIRVCNVWLFESDLPLLSANPPPKARKYYARLVRAADEAAHRIATALRRRCVR